MLKITYENALELYRLQKSLHIENALANLHNLILTIYLPRFMIDLYIVLNSDAPPNLNPVCNVGENP